MSVVVSSSERRWALKWALFVVALSCLPYLLAWQLAPAGTHYSGLLVNHLDGASYLAKMQQGARGDWLFHLPYTSEPHSGAFVYTFYLALGHLAAAFYLPIPLVYHLARAAASLYLLLVAYRLVARCFDRPPARRMAFLLLSLSAGFGWLLAPAGLILSDLWVTEGFTFLSILTNPHFPLAIALMLALCLNILDAGEQPAEPRRLVGRAARCAVIGLLLAIVQPFAVPVILVVLGTFLVLALIRDRHLPWAVGICLAAAGLGAAPVMFYDLYAFSNNLALAAWSAQNVTTSLPPWNYALGYGLILILAVPGVVAAIRRRRAADLLLLAWVFTVALLLYVPFALQRRFIIGLHVPLTLLAALGLEQVVWPRLARRWRGLVTGAVIILSSLTSLFVPLVAVAGVAAGGGPLVLSQDEAAAYTWLAHHTAWTDTVLAPVEAGPLIPARAGNRVVYGHPFETIAAESKKEAVELFFSARATPAQRRALLEQYDVRYLFVPDVSHQPELVGLDLEQVWADQDAALFRVKAGQ